MNAYIKTRKPVTVGCVLLLSFCLITPIGAKEPGAGESSCEFRSAGQQRQGLLPQQEPTEKPQEKPVQEVEEEKPVTTITIDIIGGKFKFKEIHVGKGEPVRWVNFGSVPLVVKIGDTESPPLQDKSEWTHVFKTTGKHTFQIKSNPDEKGMIIVK